MKAKQNITRTQRELKGKKKNVRDHVDIGSNFEFDRLWQGSTAEFIFPWFRASFSYFESPCCFSAFIRWPLCWAANCRAPLVVVVTRVFKPIIQRSTVNPKPSPFTYHTQLIIGLSPIIYFPLSYCFTSTIPTMIPITPTVANSALKLPTTIEAQPCKITFIQLS